MSPRYQYLLEKHLCSLSTEFRLKVERLIENCFNRGAVMCPLESMRTPMEQAKYWKQSRSEVEVIKKTEELKRLGAHFLADCIYHAISKPGPRITNAIPGLSWHQWGEAIDFMWIPDNKPVWDIDIKINNINGYQIYADEAKNIGIECGLFWKDFVDATHIQLKSIPHPGMLYSVKHISNEMERRFL